MRRMTVSCWKSFSPKIATSGSTMWKSFATTVLTPSMCPGRNSPSDTRRSSARRRSVSVTTATPSPSRSAAAAAVNGPWVRAYRPTRSPSGSATGSTKAIGTPMGSGTPSASRSRLASSIAAVVADELGKAFKPDRILFVDALPKTRSAKIVRRAVRAKALGTDPGDLSSLENPESLDQIEAAVA